jgi:hypothetical protein
VNLFSSDLSDAARKHADIAIAMAEERLLETHVEHALKLIELTGSHIEFDEALDIYTRLLRLTADDARSITTQALARLGERGAPSAWTEKKVPAEAPDQDRRSLLTSLRSRLRGRVNDELRTFVEYQAARTEVALLETHVQNALHFVDILGSESAPNEAVELYLDALEVRDSIAEVVYYIALARVAENLLPGSTVPGAGAGAKVPLQGPL